MNYLIHITECIKHSQLPAWALMILAEVETYYSNYPVSGPERGPVLQTIDGMIDALSFDIRSSRTGGDIIPTSIEDNDMTVFSLSGKTPYIKLSFKPTKREKIIDPFSI